MSPQPRLRVVVVTFDPGDALGAFLDSLAAATREPYEVVLADNGSTDGAVQAAAGRDGVRVLATGGNVGYGRAANAGAADTGTPWLVVANPDIVWAPGALDALLAAGERCPRAGALGPAILTPAGDLYPSARALPTLGRGIGHAALGWAWPGNPWTAAYRREREVPVEGPAGWLSGSCLLLRTAAWEEVGGFDPTYWMYFEDVDLGARLGAAGWDNVYVPSATVTHAGGHATMRAPALMSRAHHASAYTYLSRVYRGPRHLPTRVLLRGGLAARSVLTRAPGVGDPVGAGARPTRPGSVLRGHAERPVGGLPEEGRT